MMPRFFLITATLFAQVILADPTVPWVIQGGSFAFNRELARAAMPTWHECQAMCVDSQGCNGWFWWVHTNGNGMCSTIDTPRGEWKSTLREEENTVSCPAKECRSACDLELLLRTEVPPPAPTEPGRQECTRTSECGADAFCHMDGKCQSNDGPCTIVGGAFEYQYALERKMRAFKWEDCQALCLEFDNCEAWLWYEPESTGFYTPNYGMCQLTTGVETGWGVEKADNVVSCPAKECTSMCADVRCETSDQCSSGEVCHLDGLCHEDSCVIEDAAFHASHSEVVATFIERAESTDAWELCQRRCADDAVCESWAWDMETGECDLMTSMIATVPAKGVMSCPTKTCNHNCIPDDEFVYFPGGLYESQRPGTPDVDAPPSCMIEHRAFNSSHIGVVATFVDSIESTDAWELCRHHCTDDAECDAWTWDMVRGTCKLFAYLPPTWTAVSMPNVLSCSTKSCEYRCSEDRNRNYEDGSYADVYESIGAKVAAAAGFVFCCVGTGFRRLRAVTPNAGSANPSPTTNGPASPSPTTNDPANPGPTTNDPASSSPTTNGPVHPAIAVQIDRVATPASPIHGYTEIFGHIEFILDGDAINGPANMSPTTNGPANLSPTTNGPASPTIAVQIDRMATPSPPPIYGYTEIQGPIEFILDGGELVEVPQEKPFPLPEESSEESYHHEV